MQMFVAIIGQRNSGKSTVIRSLTGCPTNSYRDFIVDDQSARSIYVSCGSPQEDPRRLQDLEELKHTLDQVSSREGCSGFVMAIQPSRPNVRLSMEQIFSEVRGRNFQVCAYVLDPGRNNNQVPFEAVSERLAAFGIVPTPLDGRRFAQLNALLINSVTHIAS